jgi:hypothetical protein
MRINKRLSTSGRLKATCGSLADELSASARSAMAQGERPSAGQWWRLLRAHPSEEIVSWPVGPLRR